MDPVTKEMTLYESDPEIRVDFGSLKMDRNTREIISTSYSGDKTILLERQKRGKRTTSF
jgi:hypothetical protein